MSLAKGFVVMRLIYMGSPRAVVAPLSALLAPGSGHSVAAVVSQKAKPVGRGGKVADPPLAVFAKEAGLPVLQPSSARDPAFLDEMRALAPDVIITAAYGQILSPSFLEIPRRGTINIHPSLLPCYRGATPVAAALLDGRTESGISILFTVEKLDAGNIILQEPYALGGEKTAGELTEEMFARSGPLLLDALQRLGDPAFSGTPQNESLAIGCRKIKKEDALVDWSAPRRTIVNRFRAFAPWPGAYTFLGEKRMCILELDVPQTLAAADRPSRTPGAAVFDKATRTVRVEAGDGSVFIRRLQPAGGKPLAGADFWNGIKNRDNVRFTREETP